MKKEKKERFILVVIVVLAIIAFTGALTPVQAGVLGLIQNLMKWGGLTLLFGCIDLIVIVALISAKKIDKKSIFVLVLLTSFCIFGSFFSFQTIRAFSSPKETVVCSDYKLRYNVVRKSTNTRRLTMIKEDGSTVTIEITRDMYNELKQDKRTIKVTYYPYVNIVDTIEYID